MGPADVAAVALVVGIAAAGVLRATAAPDKPLLPRRTEPRAKPARAEPARAESRAKPERAAREQPGRERARQERPAPRPEPERVKPELAEPERVTLPGVVPYPMTPSARVQPGAKEPVTGSILAGLSSVEADERTPLRRVVSGVLLLVVTLGTAVAVGAVILQGAAALR